jgi:hypothetical protein
MADWVRNMPSPPAAIMAYSCQLVNRAAHPWEKALVMPFISAAVSPNVDPAATASTAVWRALLSLAPRPRPAGPRRPQATITATKARLMPTAATHAYQRTFPVRAADGDRKYSSPARPAVIAAAEPHSRPRIRDPKTREARISVAGSSRTRIGSTTASSPLLRALACNRKPTVMASMPPNHIGWCARLQMSFRVRFCFCGASRLAFRWSTEDMAFAHAASTASR